MEDTEFISQMTGFSSLSEMENIAKDIKALREVQSSYNTQMLIGREVSGTGADGATVEGVVTRIAREGRRNDTLRRRSKYTDLQHPRDF